jgi:AcrR family transcriptional regulator
VRTTFQRARQPAQKEQRRAHLLATARALLAGAVPLRALSLNELARQAEMAKANVYTYFESREALLLALLWDEWERWFRRLQDGALLDARRIATLDDVVAGLAVSLAREPLLCALTAALPSVIEQNLSEAAIRAFKREALILFAQVAEHLARQWPFLPAATYAELIHDAAQAIVGIYPATHPCPAAAAALTDPALSFFRRDFEAELTRFLGALAAAHARHAPRSPTETAYSGDHLR